MVCLNYHHLIFFISFFHLNIWIGVSHAEELQSLFPIAKHLFVSAISTELDDKVRKSIVALWVNFARTG